MMKKKNKKEEEKEENNMMKKKKKEKNMMRNMKCSGCGKSLAARARALRRHCQGSPLQ